MACWRDTAASSSLTSASGARPMRTSPWRGKGIIRDELSANTIR